MLHYLLAHISCLHVCKQMQAIWDNLSVFIISMLQRQRGVLLPNLGNFKVGPVVGDSSQKKIRPSFSLLEGRYGGVSQERPRYIVGKFQPMLCHSQDRKLKECSLNEIFCVPSTSPHVLLLLLMP